MPWGAARGSNSRRFCGAIFGPACGAVFSPAPAGGAAVAPIVYLNKRSMVAKATVERGGQDNASPGPPRFGNLTRTQSEAPRANTQTLNKPVFDHVFQFPCRRHQRRASPPLVVPDSTPVVAARRIETTARRTFSSIPWRTVGNDNVPRPVARSGPLAPLLHRSTPSSYSNLNQKAFTSASRGTPWCS